MLPTNQAHRSGALKQTNKTHKHGRHRSKGSISVASKGKVSVKVLSKRRKLDLSKLERRNQSVQLRRNKRDEVLSRKRSLGGFDHAPFLVCLLPLHKYIDGSKVLKLLNECDSEIVSNKTSSGVTHLSIPRFKQRFSFVLPSLDNDLEVLDTLKVSDTVLFVVSAEAGIGFGDALIDEWGHNILQAVFAQGLPTPVVAVTDLSTIATKKQNEHKQNIQKIVAKFLPDEKVVVLDKNADGLNLLRKIGNQKQKRVVYRDRRPHMYAEHFDYIADEDGLGTLKLTGYLRGTPLSVNGLVHIPGLGDFQMLQIDAPYEPMSPLKKNDKTSMESDDETETIRVLERADPSKQQTLVSENPVDPMDAEQTWPTAEEIKDAEENQKAKKVKRVPKGWSEYQAAWIPDEDADFSSDETSDETDEYVDAMSEEKSDNSEEEEFEDVTESEIAANDHQYDQQMDLYNEKEDLQKMKAAKSDALFPDEIDTPQDTTARVRFQKYRGMESFRTSPWDAKENLPYDYGRIFQFANFDRTKKRVVKEQEDVDGALPGWYIRVHIKAVPQSLWSDFRQTGSPLTVFGLFPHEHKMSVMNVVLKRTPNFDNPIHSKEKLVFQCGYRRFAVNPIFSQHTNGSKHKMERFFRPESTVVATFYAPIQFRPAPVLCYKEVNDKLVLVGTGSLLSCNPDRIVVKRIVLSGHPFKVHKRSAVVRFMFFNRDDIVYFKPCKLRTKLGRIGHIKEPLGTHGHMKCVFDGQLKSQDTVLLNLYKRVFPKWTYEECVAALNKNSMET